MSRMAHEPDWVDPRWDDQRSTIQSDITMSDIYGADRCGICEEPFTGSRHEEVGEFVTAEWDVDTSKQLGFPCNKHVVAHAQCGITAELEMA